MNDTPPPAADPSDPTPDQVEAWLGEQPPGSESAVPGSPPDKTWPTVIGVIAIVFGGFAALFAVFGMLAPLFNQFMMEVLPADQTASFEAQMKYQWLGAALSAAALGLGLWLLFGGIGLLKLRPTAPQRIRHWAWAKIVLVFLMTGFQVLVQKQVLASMPQQQGGAAMPEGVMTAMIGLGVLFGLFWGVALPVFMLIWFSRQAIRDDMQRWESPTPADGA